MINRMLKDSKEFVAHLMSNKESAQPLTQLRRQLKHCSKNELVTMTAALLIAKNILDDKLAKETKSEETAPSAAPDISSNDTSNSTTEPTNLPE